MKAETAAVKLKRERGYVVIGFPAGCPEYPEKGEVLDRFAGGPLTKHRLVLGDATTRQDWNEQLRVIGEVSYTRKPKPAKGQRFYRWEVVKA